VGGTPALYDTFHPRADARVLAFLAGIRPSHVCISALTIGELRRGVVARRHRDETHANRLAVWVDGIEAAYSDRILAVDSRVARIWGELSAAWRLPVVDTLLAATAVVHDLALVTRNVRDVATTGVQVVDPWRPG
jgi:hypothetical protein